MKQQTHTKKERKTKKNKKQKEIRQKLNQNILKRQETVFIGHKK